MFRGYLKVKKPGCSMEKGQQGFLANGFPKIIFHSRLLGLSGGNDLYHQTAKKSQHFMRKGTRPAIFQVHDHYPQNEQVHGCFLTFKKSKPVTKEICFPASNQLVSNEPALKLSAVQWLTRKAFWAQWKVIYVLGFGIK